MAEVQQNLRDLAFVARLDDIYYRKFIWVTDEGGKRSWNAAIASPEYRKAFEESGLDVTELTSSEAAKRIAESGVKVEIIAAIDDWSLFEPKVEIAHRLLAVARLADPGDWLNRLRDPAIRKYKTALQKLASEAYPERLQPRVISVLVTLMFGHQLDPGPLLQVARASNPSEFELAFLEAGWRNWSKKGNSVGPYEAARALRPEIRGYGITSALRWNRRVTWTAR